MKTFEELKGMTQEDLVRLVQELQDENISLKKEVESWISSNVERKEKIESLILIVKKLSSLLP